MMDQLVLAAKERITEALKDKVSLDESQLAELLQVAKAPITDSMKKEFFSGNMNGIVDLLTGKETATNENPIVKNTVANLANAFIGKMNMDTEKSNLISSTVIPTVINVIGEKFKESGNSADVGGLLKFLNLGGSLGGMLGSMGGMLGGFFGKKD